MCDGISNLPRWLNVVTRDELVISIEELNTTFLECALRQEQTLDSR